MRAVFLRDALSTAITAQRLNDRKYWRGRTSAVIDLSLQIEKAGAVALLRELDSGICANFVVLASTTLFHCEGAWEQDVVFQVDVLV